MAMVVVDGSYFTVTLDIFLLIFDIHMIYKYTVGTIHLRLGMVVLIVPPEIALISIFVYWPKVGKLHVI